MWELPALDAYQQWAAEIVLHFTAHHDQYSAPYAANVTYVRFGAFVGGEATLPCPYEATQTLGVNNLTVSMLTSYITSLYTSIMALDPPFRVDGPFYGGDPNLNPNYCGINLGANACITQTYSDAEAAAMIASGVGISNQSLSAFDVYNYAQGRLCGSDSCNLFNLYSQAAPLFTWQTFSISNPSCLPWNQQCQNATGSLVNTLPFATVRLHAGQSARRLTVLEIPWQDWLCAYSGSVTSDCTTGPQPNQSYQTALSNASLGLPNGTVTSAGDTSTAGSVAVQ
jgi:hypothetical protein